MFRNECSKTKPRAVSTVRTSGSCLWYQIWMKTRVLHLSFVDTEQAIVTVYRVQLSNWQLKWTNCRGLRSRDSLTMTSPYVIVAFVVGTFGLLLSWSVQQNSPLEGYWNKTRQNNNYWIDILEGLVKLCSTYFLSICWTPRITYDSRIWQGMQLRKTTLKLHRTQWKSQRTYLAFHSWKKRQRYIHFRFSFMSGC